MLHFTKSFFSKTSFPHNNTMEMTDRSTVMRLAASILSWWHILWFQNSNTATTLTAHYPAIHSSPATKPVKKVVSTWVRSTKDDKSNLAFSSDLKINRRLLPLTSTRRTVHGSLRLGSKKEGVGDYYYYYYYK